MTADDILMYIFVVKHKTTVHLNRLLSRRFIWNVALLSLESKEKYMRISADVVTGALMVKNAAKFQK